MTSGWGLPAHTVCTASSRLTCSAPSMSTASLLCAGVGILSFDVYDGLPVQRLPLQRVGAQSGSGALAAAPGLAGGGLDGFEDLEAVLSPETAAASRAAEAEAAEAAKGSPTDAPKSGVTLLGGLVTAQSKVRRGGEGQTIQVCNCLKGLLSLFQAKQSP